VKSGLRLELLEAKKELTRRSDEVAGKGAPYPDEVHISIKGD
jgi:hypothetical protein